MSTSKWKLVSSRSTLQIGRYPQGPLSGALRDRARKRREDAPVGCAPSELMNDGYSCGPALFAIREVGGRWIVCVVPELGPSVFTVIQE